MTSSSFWEGRAENDDGRVRTVRVRVEAHVVAAQGSVAGGGELFEVRDAIETQGMSVIEQRRYRAELPTSFEYRRGSSGFV